MTDGQSEQAKTLLEAKLAAVIEWLEQNQPDVFNRGLWDAIEKASEEESHDRRTK